MELPGLDEPLPPRERGIFCNRTLNLRSIRAVGYDMDYTLVQYDTRAWEERAYEHVRRRLAALGMPTADLAFDPELVIRGLVIDTELGNVIKCNRFGFVKSASHGTRPLSYDEQRTTYARTIVDLAEKRWVFMNTLFSLSEGCMYAQLVDRLDERRIDEVLGYADLYERVRRSVDETHMEGTLKAEIMADPEKYVVLDPETPQALIDQRLAGKKLMIITNSEWDYTQAMMRYAFDRFLPAGQTWRDLFDVIIVAAQKPTFFQAKNPLFEVVSEEGLLRPAPGGLREGRAYLGGHAALVERSLGLSGDEILYVGDHIYGDVHVSKSVLRWRTALILHELEAEIAATAAALDDEQRLARLMEDKTRLEHAFCMLRLFVQRERGGEPRAPRSPAVDAAQERMTELRARIDAHDTEIAPLAKAAASVSNPRWGLLLRAGNDKSHLARQLERSADVYTSRVSNFVLASPFVYLRSPRGSLPHDRSATPGRGPEAPDPADV